MHELIRGNVLTATRNYQQRVKHFIRQVAMGANSPMHVKNYTYTVEFQDRGAGHIHGTLWLRLDKIEKMVKEVNGIETPVFTRLAEASKKFRNNVVLEHDELKAVKYFIDEYTSVSTHENTVGIEVARIVREVNKHHHTKTCTKHDTTCRFKYPRYPSPHTIIVKPCTGETQEDIDAKLAMYRRILIKVREVLEDEDQIKKILEKYKKQEESQEEYKENMKLRIKDLC